MTTINTRLGAIEGVADGDIQTFLGIRYGQAPVADRRFKAARMEGPWQGTYDATRIRHRSWQPKPEGFFADLIKRDPADYSVDEDCLFLNVYTPGCDDGGRPVLFWIHGGAFGSGSGYDYNGTALAAQGDVVVVTINYRLGFPGFLDLSAYGDEYRGSASNGIGDQVLALRWVHENIGDYGGDPGNVTIFGESAGGAAVACLLVSPEAQGLAHRAIGMSTAGDHGILFDGTEPCTEQLYAQLRVEEPSPELLRSMPASDLLAAQAAVEAAAFESLEEMWSMRLPFGPIVDGAFLIEPPLATAAAASAARGIPFLSGNPDEEMKLIRAMMPPEVLSEAEVMARLEQIPGGARRVYDAYHGPRSRRGESSTPDNILDAIASDFLEIMPSLRFADAWARGGAPTFGYTLDWKSPMNEGALGSCHALDIPFAFGTYDQAPNFAGSGPNADALANTMMDIWATFARTGNPSIEGLEWPAYAPDDRAQVMLGPRVRVETAWRATERSVWDEVF